MKTSVLSFIIGLGLFTSGLSLAQETPAAAPETLPAETTAAAVETIPENVKKLIPANLLPIGEFTSYYKQKSATIESTDGSQVNMTYFWFEPEVTAAEGETFPLVLVLHGTQGYAEPAYNLIRESVRKPNPAYILVPTLPAGQRWADPGKLKPVHSLPDAITLLKKMMAENPIDPARIYVMGCGTGGAGTYGAAQLYSDIFAAAVPIGATWNPKETDKMSTVALAAFHGSEDEFFTHYNSSDTITMVQSHGGTAFFTLFDGMKHDCNAANIYTPALWQWLFSQKKAIPEPTP
ncbi:MAG: prolyl oligopeptidase family serine peptidase [Alphaproteobacteria bacterium]|nr:prolyl oligopeptidase family serine peptidase [Alphaproteobacteria bacterium]